MPGGGPESKTWLEMNLLHNKRNVDILGDPNRFDCADANECSRFAAFLSLIALVRHVDFWWEQPLKSVFFQAPWWNYDMIRNTASFTRFWMQAFGHVSPKPSIVFGTLEGLSALDTPKPRGNIIKLHKSTKHKRWRSGYHTKQSQVYPWKFCVKIFELFQDQHPMSGATEKPNNVNG